MKGGLEARQGGELQARIIECSVGLFEKENKWICGQSPDWV